MKTPLHYQMTEYDCGPISMMNAIIFLFDREDIPPDLIRASRTEGIQLEPRGERGYIELRAVRRIRK